MTIPSIRAVLPWLILTGVVGVLGVTIAQNITLPALGWIVTPWTLAVIALVATEIILFNSGFKKTGVVLLIIAALAFPLLFFGLGSVMPEWASRGSAPAVNPPATTPPAAPAPAGEAPLPAAWRTMGTWIEGLGLPIHNNPLVVLILLTATAIVLYCMYSVVKSGGSKWSNRIGSFAFGLILIWGVAASMWGVDGANRLFGNFADSTGAALGIDTTTPRTRTLTPPTRNGPAITVAWSDINSVSFPPLTREQGCLRWTIDTPTFNAVRARLGDNPTQHFGWETRGGGVAPKPTAALVAAVQGRNPVAFVRTLPCTS